ncbi:DUF11 domain-containing protein [Leptolyngbya cf. ectocarpi LEGE 11479]|uniref:DUF11 domain-containing protein n=1 Tax=Leptolyngbya cf. ectocarpi LEGE 11479 TaxID=1828722 RepID=A0A929FAG5_LEPEC|nr:DUF11 domain-containing protein [Leptolyngbya ectocarpi]MBE9069966.1 DUF11 domain-containing protein [Leptolyngbya cf. ectocarpi LEGE 11479]
MTLSRPPKLKPDKHRSWMRRMATVLLLSSLQTPYVAIAQASTLYNQADYNYIDDRRSIFHSGSSSETALTTGELIDPLGQILGCNGELLPNYDGFSVVLYEPDASGLELGPLIPLTRTELPDIENNGVPGGNAPNIENSNPFFLTNTDAGQYNFLFSTNTPLQSPINAGLNQTDKGAQYILVVNTPDDSIYPQRRIKIELVDSTGGVNNSIIRYTATSLDGIPISTSGGSQISSNVVEIFDAETQGLNLFSLALGMVMCEPEQIEITKTADRAAAQPGDTVVYRLALRNLTDIALESVTVGDVLPQGFQLIPESVSGVLDEQTVVMDVQASGSNVTFSTATELPVDGTMSILYAVRVTPDALRGTGENLASVNAERSDNGFFVQDGPSIHRLVVDPGILTDCATLVGRVFVDKNFDGEQQPGEAGIPNAVVFLDDGNRIITDADGLFSVACMLPGTRSGVLDFTSLPGYALAPNLYFKERNSQSRMVNIAPGGMVRMNFGVTPTFQEEAQ